MIAHTARTSRRSRSRCALALGLTMLTGALVAVGVPAQGQAPKRGGVLNSMIIEDPPGFSIHESATVSTVWPVVFRLKRPQPSLLLMLASGYMPVYPAHVPVADLRQRCVGTGPFKLKDYQRGQVVELERNPDYFVANRPYLDGIRYLIITERGTRLAALQSGRLDAFAPLEMTKLMSEAAKKAQPSLIVSETGQLGSDNVVINHSLYNWGRMQEVWLDK